MPTIDPTPEQLHAHITQQTSQNMPTRPFQAHCHCAISSEVPTLSAATIAELRKDSALLTRVLAHPETAAEALEDAAAGDGSPRGNLERRMAALADGAQYRPLAAT